MENLISRYRNVTILAALLFGQVLGLAVQVKRSTENESSRLIRIWAVSAVTPLEKGIVSLQSGASHLWHNYFYLRGVRQENRELKQRIEQLEIERVRLSEDAEQAHRLQALLSFKEQFVARTLAAQVIGSSGSQQSRSVYIDKGSKDGVKSDMAVITADGIVGKVLRVFKSTSQVLLINDQTSGVGAMLEKSRLQGVLRGTPEGEVVLEKVMSDEAVQPGERIVSSGGDQIFPKGFPVGTISKVDPGRELFLNIRVKPAVDLSRLEEVLVITQQEVREPALDTTRMRAADILAQRLPSVPEKPPGEVSKVPPPTSGLKILPPPAAAASSQTAGVVGPKPVGAAMPGQKAATTAKPPGNSPGPRPANASSTEPAGGATEGKPSDVQHVVVKPPAAAATAPTANSQGLPKPAEPAAQEPTPPQDQPQ